MVDKLIGKIELVGERGGRTRLVWVRPVDHRNSFVAWRKNNNVCEQATEFHSDTILFFKIDFLNLNMMHIKDIFM